MDLKIKPVDKLFYDTHLGYLPPRMIDIHTHVWLDAHRQPSHGWPGADQHGRARRARKPDR